MALHIVPDDGDTHLTDGSDCWCMFDVQYIDPVTKLYYDEPHIIHAPDRDRSVVIVDDLQ